MSNDKTIRMPADMLAKWLEGLRSGKFRQGKGRLETADGCYCCLGVLQMVTDGSVERAAGPAAWPLPCPSIGWLERHGIEFHGKFGDTTNSPYIPTLGDTAWAANDNYGKTFAEIADAIEACAEATPKEQAR